MRAMRIFNRNEKFLKRIHWWRVLIFLGIAFVLALPWPLYKTIAKFDKQSQQISVINLETGIQPVVPSLFTTLTNIPLNLMARVVCLVNRNTLFVGGVQEPSSQILNSQNAGAMTITLHYPDATTQDISAVVGTTTCVTLNQNFKYATTTNEVNVAMPLPVYPPFFVSQTASGTYITARLASYSAVGMASSSIIEKVSFSLWTYLLNIFDVVVGLSILLVLFLTLKPYISS